MIFQDENKKLLELQSRLAELEQQQSKQDRQAVASILDGGEVQPPVTNRELIILERAIVAQERRLEDARDEEKRARWEEFQPKFQKVRNIIRKKTQELLDAIDGEVDLVKQGFAQEFSSRRLQDECHRYLATRR